MLSIDYKKAMDIYSVLKLLSGGAVHILFKNKIARRRIVKVLKGLKLDSIEEVEKALASIKDLKPLFLLKKGLKYLDEKDVDKFLKNYLTKRGIDFDNIKEQFSEFSSKVGTKKINSVLGVFDEVERILVLKHQKLMKDIDDYEKLGKSVKAGVAEYKVDFRVAVEKQLLKREGEINDIEKEKIKQEAIQEYIAKVKAQAPKSLKQGIKIGK